MRKELIIVILIVFFVIGTNILTQNYTKKSIEELNNELEEIKTELLSEDIEEKQLEKKMDDIMNSWREKFNKFAYYIEHDELEKVETELSSLKAHIKVEEYEEGVNDIERGIYILNHIKEKFRFTFKNIF